MALLNRIAWLSAVLVLAASLVCALAGVTYGNVDLLATFAVTLFWIGRHGRNAWAGPLVTAGLAVTSAMREPLSIKNVTVSFLVFGSTWVFGRIVRDRALRAHRAVAASEALARQDPARLSARAVADERSRVTDEALSALTGAVHEMRDVASVAHATLDPSLIVGIRDSGVAAVQQLRQLLGLLRQAPDAPLGPPDEQITARSDWWSGWLRDQLATAALAAVSLVSALLAPHWQWTPAMLGLHVTLLLGVAVRRWVPTLACLAVAAATSVVALSPPTHTDMLLPTSIGYVLLAWAAATAPAWHTRLALGLLALSALAVAATFGPAAVGYILVVFTGAVLARHSWDERDQILQSAEHRRDDLQTRLDHATESALRAERLRIARDLHDVSSHAVGVMVLQAGVAEALRLQDPDRARSALHTVMDAGAEALAEIEGLRTMLGSPHATSFEAGADALRPALEELITRRSANLVVHARLDELPGSPELAQITLRIVQEALTNAARHAPGSSVRVEVSHAANRYVVRVRDNGTHRQVQPEHVGFGLAGLAERVHACGGAFSAGRLPTRGFEVVGSLPSGTDGAVSS